MAVLRILFLSASFPPASTRSDFHSLLPLSCNILVSTGDSVMERFAYLPVATVLDQLTTALGRGHAVLSGPTGSGKTTLVPLALLTTAAFSSGRIIMLEPRRIAARAAAVRMSAMLGEHVGTTIGYRTRDESRVSAATRIEVVTEGILIRKLQRDPELSNCSLIIFDEFHERSLQADLGLALCLDLCQLRDDLRLLVMSATLETTAICKLLGNAPHVSATGMSYPVSISHLPALNEQAPIAQQMVRGILHAWQHTTGDILAFLPGAGEIRHCRQLLEEALSEPLILPLYGNLSHQEQDRIFERGNERRRIILATPIAETSITIEGISCVVDSGYYRRPVHDHASGLSRLATFRISRASAAQRAGRAGRLGPGQCFRLWSKEVDYSLLEHTPPEIISGDISSLVLELALWGVTDPHQLDWLDPPRETAWQKTVQLLQGLNLLDQQQRITQLGRDVASLPVHPRLGVLLVKGAELNLTWTACLVAAVLTDRDIFTGYSRSADIEERVQTLARFADKPASLPPHADRALCSRMLKYARQWLHLLSTSTEQKPATADLGNLLAFGFPDRVAMLRADSNYRYQLASGSGVELPPADPLSGSTFLVVSQVDIRKGDGRIFLAAPISLDDIRDFHKHLLEERELILWHDKEKRVKASLNSSLGKIILHSKPLIKPDETLVAAAFLDGVRQGGAEQLPWTREAREFQARICALNFWQPGKWLDVADEPLMTDMSWLAGYCQQMRSIEQLRGLNLTTILRSLLSWEQQVQLDKLAPSHIQVPSGSRIRLEYSTGKQPVLAVRLQELFGLIDTPRVCNDQVPVVLHLLSPARRPMQVTSDLRSFWVNTYPEVRKELAGRYPKHYWPENPLTAEATTKTKKQTGSKRG